jgi:hypothetical protein
MAKIVAARYIDNGGKEATDVTTSIKPNGITQVDSSLIPTFSTSVELTPVEDQQIQRQAEEECKGANDQTCLKATKFRLNQAKLQEKQQEQNLKVPQGPALAVTTFEKGKGFDTTFIPQGKKFVTRDGALIENPKEESKASGDPTKAVTQAFTTFVATFGGAIAAGLYVLGVLLTWKTFMGYDYRKSIVIAMTVIAGIFPGSGYLLSLGAWIYQGYTTATATASV